MSAPQNFRSAFNGFNREDVVKYLEYLNARNRAQVNQLTAENEYLRQQLEQTQAVSQDSREIQGLRAQLEELRSIRSALEARCAGMERELEQAQAAGAAGHCRVEQELETYRRAERMEREARERADRIYTQTNAVLGEAAAQVDSVAGEIGSLADLVTGQLSQLQNAVTSSKQALKNAADALYTMHPQD